MSGLAALATLALAASAVLQAPVARAQDASEQDRLFQRMTSKPTDLDATFAYAKAATARGDYEAAIGALERVLFFQPRLGKVKYELGSLYYRLGSYEMARRYFKEAQASGDLDEATKGLIDAAMPNAEKQLRQSRLSGFLQTGVRYQSNASFGTTGDNIRLGGQTLSLLGPVSRRSDVNAFEIAGISHDYDLDNQRGDTIETRFIGYGTQQARVTNLNLGVVDATFGPRLALSPEQLPGVTVKPYAVGGEIFVGGRSYLSSGGAGISFHIPAPAASIDPFFEYRRIDVNNGAAVPVSTFNTGNDFTVGLSVGRELTRQVQLTARGFYQRGDAITSFNVYDQFAGEAALTYAFRPLLGSAPRNWTVSPFARVVFTSFAAPNPFIDPTVRRQDNEQVAGIVFDTPISKTFGATTTVQYDHIGSTLPNFRVNNFSVMFGPTARF